MPDLPFDFLGRVALITGGGRGIGRSTAIALAQVGADVAVVSRSRPELDEVVAQIKVAGHRGLGICQDMSEPAAPGRILEECLGAFGRLDVLVDRKSTRLNSSH